MWQWTAYLGKWLHPICTQNNTNTSLMLRTWSWRWPALSERCTYLKSVRKLFVAQYLLCVCVWVWVWLSDNDSSICIINTIEDRTRNRMHPSRSRQSWNKMGIHKDIAKFSDRPNLWHPLPWRALSCSYVVWTPHLNKWSRRIYCSNMEKTFCRTGSYLAQFLKAIQCSLEEGPDHIAFHSSQVVQLDGHGTLKNFQSSINLGASHLPYAFH